jgi:hypothetical protein
MPEAAAVPGVGKREGVKVVWVARPHSGPARSAAKLSCRLLPADSALPYRGGRPHGKAHRSFIPALRRLPHGHRIMSPVVHQLVLWPASCDNG